MERKFYDRFEELDFLKNKFDKMTKGEFGVLYGRRRVGKSELLRKFVSKVKEKNVYMNIIDSSKGEFRRTLSKKLEECFGEVVKINTWSDFFEYIEEKVKDKKLLLVFDEFQRIDSFAKDFIYSLQEFWDNSLKNSKIMIIISGSSMSMMHRLALEEKGPLYGRKTFTIPLKQFRYVDFREMFKESPEEDKIKIFSIFGGTPKYLTDFRESKLDLLDSIKELVLSRRGSLYDEPINALKFELKSPDRYIAILKAISCGKIGIREIADTLDFKQEQLTPYLKNLVNLLDILQASNPLFGKKKMKRYMIKDNFFRFWYRFVYPYKEQLDEGIEETIIKRMNKELFDYYGRIFEEIIKEFFLFIRGREIKGNKIEFDEYGKWWEENEDIDLVLRNRGKAVFVEIKFKNKKMGSHCYEELKRKSLKTSASGKFEYIIVSKEGFEQELIDRKIPNLLLLSLKDISKILDDETKREKEIQENLIQYFGI